MARVKITQKILILKKDVELIKDLTLSAGTEIEIVSDVVYIKGYPVPPEMQNIFFNWILKNMNDNSLFKEDFRRFK